MEDIWEADWTANPFPRTTTASDLDYENLQPNFCYLPVSIIKKTFQATTQFAKMPASTTLFKRFKTPHPFANCLRRNEDVASDTVYADTPAIDCGHTCAQIFYGCRTQVTDVKGMSRPKKFLRALQDVARERGAMKRLLVDSANVECSEKVMDYLGMLVIEFWQSEPWQQHQQPSEQRWQTVKRVANRLLNFTGAPPNCWLLACEYVCFVLNHCATPFLNFQVPLQMLTEQVVEFPLC